MVKLPSFTDVKDFNESLLRIEAWFEKIIEVRKNNNGKNYGSKRR